MRYPRWNSSVKHQINFYKESLTLMPEQPFQKCDRKLHPSESFLKPLMLLSSPSMHPFLHLHLKVSSPRVNILQTASPPLGPSLREVSFQPHSLHTPPSVLSS
uniref:Uncharacterized protein n=1 Tax=Arundo donax TaxID=35708 RepID=A0A0A9CUF0_ARUDO